jgi:hypothetical protein
MTNRYRPQAEDPDQLALRVGQLHDQLRLANPKKLATNTGVTYLPADPQRGTFYLPLWGQAISLTYPEFTGRDARTGELLSTFSQALLAYYFTISDGTPPTGKWISFSELPEGRFYSQAFQGYTGGELAKIFGDDEEGFARASARAGGQPPHLEKVLGDQAFSFRVLPRVSLLAVCWLGDEDFPSSFNILFDAAVSHHLSTDACAIVGGTLTRRLIKNYQAMKGH